MRRSRSDPTEVAYYVVFAPNGTPLRTLARVAGQRWRSEQEQEQSFALAKGEVGLDHYEARRWGRLVSPYDLGNVRPGLSRRAARLQPQPPVLSNQNRLRSLRGASQQPIDLNVDLLPVTVPEIRHVLWAVGQPASAEATRLVFTWSEWRRRH